MPLISIIVPIYNAEKYLSECLESLLNQTYSNLEIICINDGSTDNSLKIINSYAQKDSRIKVYSQSNQGVSKTRNFGIENANGEYIMFMDSDDTCSLNTIETSLELARANDSDLVINFLDLRWELNQKSVNQFAYLATVQMFVKKDYLLKFPKIRFKEKMQIGEDAVFSHELLALTNKVCTNPQSKYYYRLHSEQTTTKFDNYKKEEALKNIKLWIKELETFYSDYNLWVTNKKHFLNFVIEQPFTMYIRLKWTNEQQQELFKLIHDTVCKYHLIDNFHSQNKREFFFNIFINCKTTKDFIFYDLIIKIFYIYVQIIKKIKWEVISKNA